jgi:hypothetical protein
MIFVFASLFLGEVRSFYERIWWWDIALHTTSGLLLGILGFLLVYVLNENERVDVHMLPRFVAFFAFTFAVAWGRCGRSSSSPWTVSLARTCRSPWPVTRSV